ncbi:CHAP domain-containing protein [Nonomuraea zeae]|uniref:CHAP domain-containing protein n=1 Tax=Nonomuraea zeae TaxID=1642303 RepID=A0A5S4GDJ0_9ACTN|nr:CHAP domain-containing protein [Nonomuraea zeae]TMR31063.1 CHAP domain-containing protein [Nonomuraea zeae]
MRQELGYKEKSGQFTKFGQWYADRVQDTQYRDAPWCDMFIAWAADRAGISDYVGQFAWTPSHAAWFIKQGAWTQQPEPGALVFFDWRGGKSYKGIDHVGVVERVEGTKIHTIEANVDRVWLKRKTRETDKVVGYGLPRMVKAEAGKLDEIRSTEQPFVPAPRAGAGQGSPLDVLGTPPALLAAMVLMTIVLSLRVSGRRRGTHRRFTWPWNAPSTGRAEKGARDRPPAATSTTSSTRSQAGGSGPKSPAATSSPRTPATPKTPANSKTPATPKTPAKAKAPAGAKTSARDKTPARQKAPAPEPPAEPDGAPPHPAPAQSGRPARTRVSAGSARAASKHAGPTRRKPYEPD